MSKSVPLLLVEALGNLSYYEFKRFLHELTNRTVNPRLRRRFVESKARGRGDVARLLINTFTEKRAVTLTVDLLKKINCRHTAEELQRRAAESFPESFGLKKGSPPIEPQGSTDITGERTDPHVFASGHLDFSTTFWQDPICIQILLFFRPTEKQNQRELHVHLLPKNVPFIKVKNRYKDFIYIKTSSDCVLRPAEEYCLSCTSHTGDIYKAEPKVYTLECNYGPDYLPAFVVYIEAESVTLTLRDKHGDEQWGLHHLFLTEKALPEDSSSLLGESSKSAAMPPSLTHVLSTRTHQIDAHVLLFYRLTDQPNMRELHVHLLPGNVPLSEVKNQYKDFMYIKTSSDCQLTPGRKYRLSCRSHTGHIYFAVPQTKQFKCNYGSNYHPAFVMYIKSEKIILTLLKIFGSEAWGPQVLSLTDVELHKDTEEAFPEGSTSSWLGESSKSALAQQSFTQPESSTDAEKFVPTVIESHLDDQNNPFYRFLCQHAGQFQCKLTNVVFDMEGKGEVQYRTESWNNHNLDVLGQMKPAGPLYNIICVEGSVSHLHLPHAQICSDEVDLAVAHFTGDNIEIIKPLAVTDTHIIIPIQGLSIFGILAKFLFSSSVDDQILLFYKLTENFRELHIHLLPGNVDLTEVRREYREHKDFMYIKTSSDCQLTPGTEYQPSCREYQPSCGDTYEAVPKTRIFNRTYSPNFHPAFVVFAEAKRISLGLLEKDGREVWPPRPLFLTDPTAVGQMNPSQPTQLTQQTPEADFIDEKWTELVERATGMGPILDALLKKKIINQEQYNEIKAKSTPHDQMRALITGPINSSGALGKHVLHSVLKEQQPYMMMDLGAP